MKYNNLTLLISWEPTTYTLATQPWVVIGNDFSNDWFINIICSLVLSLNIFISLKYQRQTSGGCSRELVHDFMNGNRNLRPTYGCEGDEDPKTNNSLCTHCVGCVALDSHWLSMSYPVHTSGGERTKWLINISMCTHCVVCFALDTPLTMFQWCISHLISIFHWITKHE